MAAAEPFWVASVPDIVAWQQALEKVEVRVRAEQPRYVFRLANGSGADLRRLTLVLPFAPSRVTVGGKAANAAGEHLILDLPARSAVEVSLWHA